MRKVGESQHTLVFAVDEPQKSGASYEYVVYQNQPEQGGQGEQIANIAFQQGNPQEGFNGILDVDLTAILIDRLEGFQKGPYADPANAVVLTHLKAALAGQQARRQARVDRGVQDTPAV